MKIKAIAGLFVAVFFACYAPVIASPIEHNEKVLPPVNDDCVNAVNLTVNSDFLCGVVTAGTLTDATASTAPSGCPGTDPSDLPNYKAGDDVWYKFVATATSHKISIAVTGGSPTDLYHMVYDGGSPADCATMTPIFCSDPETSVQTGLTIGNTYFIRVFSNSTASGATTNFDICLGTSPLIIMNDDCANAFPVTSLPFSQTYDATGATNNAGFITATGCADMNDGVWFVIAGDGGDITVNVSPNSWDAGIGIYTGSCGSLVCVDDSDIGGVDVIEGVTFSSSIGTNYYINVGFPSGSTDGAEGIYGFSVTTTTLSITDLISSGFKYYPNPVKDVLRMSANESIKRISVYSLLGREIKQVSQTDLQADVDLSNLAAGTYFVKAFVGEKSGTFKIIKE